MNTSGDVAEQMVKFYLEGFEVVAKVSGRATEHTIAIIMNILKSKNQTKGKARLNSMLKSGKPLSIFSVNKKDLPKFVKEAKRYGILYSALIDRHNKNDDVVDIMVRDDDAAKIDRVVEKYNIALPNTAKIKTKEVKNIEEKLRNSTIDPDTLRENSRNEILQSLEQKNKQILNEEALDTENFQMAKTQRPQSKPLSKKLKGNTKRKSVKKEIQEIKQEMNKEKSKKMVKTKNKKLNKNKSR